VDDKHITELDWTQGTSVAGTDLGGELRITSWPTRHFSGRGLLDRFTTLWASYVLEGPNHRVYYGGDTGYWDGFSAIAGHYDHFDVSMLPIGAFDPLWRSIHMGPEDAVQAFRDMGGPTKAGLLMPVHWGLFNLALHGWRQPIERVTELAAEGEIPLFAPTPGEPVEVVSGQQVRSPWWQATR
jgi:L-ascorbate metabolism protein UlaG (beta-lactamase superfamily)